MKNVVEDFVCENCGKKVIGNGTTDHCPNCLWGKHVDEEVPGDRASVCRALMEPMRTIYEKGELRIQYKCIGCNHKFMVRTAENDNRELLIELCR